MTTENIKKLKYRFFREFLPEKLYVRYQIVSPYYTQAPTERGPKCLEQFFNETLVEIELLEKALREVEQA